MDEIKKKKPEEETPEEKPKDGAEVPEEEKKGEKPEEESKESKPEEKASDESKAGENGEGASEDDMSEEEPEKKPEEAVPDVPQLSETDRLKAENLTLKTQLEAMKIGFAPDCMEDAVILAEAIVKRDGSDISAALQAVAKKYPDWKSDGKDEKGGKSKGGFKVGADSSDKEKKADDDKLSQAFGIKKKKC